MWKRSITILSLLGFFVTVSSAAEYYVDASQGSDQADGLSETTPWQSLKRLNKVRFSPGDVIHLRAGEVFKGQFRAKDSGSTEELIQLVSYGKGPKPQIAGQGLVQSAVLLENVSDWLIEGIEITNMGVEPQADRRGLLFKVNGGGVYRNITLRDLTVRDVNGSVSKNKGGGTGIRWEVDSRKVPTRIDDLLIENCHLIRCDRDGIKGMMSPWDDLSNLSTNVVIRGNLLEDIGGERIPTAHAVYYVTNFIRLVLFTIHRCKYCAATLRAVKHRTPIIMCSRYTFTQSDCNAMYICKALRNLYSHFRIAIDLQATLEYITLASMNV